MNPIVKTFQYGQHTVTLETGVMARQATAAVMASMDDTAVFVTVVGKKEAVEGRDFFPLTVNYQERTYAAGRIPGGFFKREGRPSEGETLIARLIDRPIRPLFPEGFLNEVQIVGKSGLIDARHVQQGKSVAHAGIAEIVDAVVGYDRDDGRHFGRRENLIDHLNDVQIQALDLFDIETGRHTRRFARVGRGNETEHACRFGHGSVGAKDERWVRREYVRLQLELGLNVSEILAALKA